MTTLPLAGRSVPSLRPIALPAEHGGWGFLLEPILLAVIVAPSSGGALIAAAFIAGFLVRQPLRFALQDALRGKHYPRTPYCWAFAAGYGALAAAMLALAIALQGVTILIPLVLAAPLAVTQIGYDAWNRNRALVPEVAGATAMSSSAAAIAIAGGWPLTAALALCGIILARSIPSIVYVRTLLARAHRREASAWPPVALHVAAIGIVAVFAPPLAVAAMIVLLVRAAWGLTHRVPRAKTIGWREIAFGAVTVALAAAGYYQPST